MTDLEILRQSFVAFCDGLWWGLRDNVGPLSMHEGYMRGFRQIGLEAADRRGGKGAENAAKVATEVLGAIGLTVKQEGRTVIVDSCPLWNRIIERGLEYAFHIEEICWIPMLSAIAEKTGSKVFCDSSLRAIHLEREKVRYRMEKAKAALDAGKMSKSEYQKQRDMLEKSTSQLPSHGLYRFE